MINFKNKEVTLLSQEICKHELILLFESAKKEIISLSKLSFFLVLMEVAKLLQR